MEREANGSEEKRERRESNRKPAKAWWSWLDDKTFFVGEKEIFEKSLKKAMKASRPKR